jgi:CheY-like chemotaxis protein
MALILIVEDALFSRRMLGKILKSQGHQILEATNGSEGLNLARERWPDCILLDLLMPEISGIEVLEQLNAQRLLIPTIVITADIQETSRQHCLELGAVAVVNKPPNQHALQAAIAKALNAHPNPSS